MDEMSGVFALVYGLISIAFLVAFLVAVWKTYVKMGEPGWVALIPFYCLWVYAKHAWGAGWKMVIALIPGVGAPIFYYKVFTGFGMNTALSIILALFAWPLGLTIAGLALDWLGE